MQELHAENLANTERESQLKFPLSNSYVVDVGEFYFENSIETDDGTIHVSSSPSDEN